MKITINDIFEALEEATEIIDKSYNKYDEVTKLDVIHDFKFELCEVLDGYTRTSDEEMALIDMYHDYVDKED